MVALANIAEEETQYFFSQAKDVYEYNQLKVLAAFHKNKISTECFNGTSGYGYNDIGREMIDKVYADIFGTEAALVRYGISSGTHALSIALFGNLRPGDKLLCATGAPYDTLKETIGIIGDGNGSLRDFGISYAQVDLLDNGEPDYKRIAEAAGDKSVKLVLIQRSKGYSYRDSLSCEKIGKIIDAIKAQNSNVICMIDNCYGEFVEKKEPTQYGADIVCGSLIKNIGGGIAETGGYVVGKEKYVEHASYKLNAIGMGRECGATLNSNKPILQGLFLAPQSVYNAIISAIFSAKMCELMGFDTKPSSDEVRTDIIQAIKFNDKDKVIAFCRGIQNGAPIDAHVTPVPWSMPGYQNEVIMAAGAFTQGSSIELSADAPIRPPYIAYMQGGLTYFSAKVGILKGLEGCKEI